LAISGHGAFLPSSGSQEAPKNGFIHHRINLNRSSKVANNWLITGTSSGFGRTLTELALERGDNVVATVRKPSALDHLQGRYGNRLRVLILDVTNPKEIASVVDEAFDAFGKIDFAVSNAGYIMVGAAEEAELPRIERLLDTNLLGSIVFAKAVIPHMRKQGGGRILQISSEQSQMAYPGMSVYATTKWGIEGFFEGVIPEIAKFGIEVTLVEPGTARTNITNSSDDTTPMEIYEDTPVGNFRRAIALHGEKILIGDPVKMAKAMIASCELKPAPRRLVLGSDAYQHIEASLIDRLALLHSQKELAFSTDLSS
jgi:NAD(P)-dependent dehydrogenase (short-subunit alcohol dehydrogenase family)